MNLDFELVSQETTLFDDTVLNNIKYANLDATEEQIHEAAKLSHCCLLYTSPSPRD